MSKDIQCNCNTRYEKRITANRRSDRNTNTGTTLQYLPIALNINTNSNDANTFRDIHLVDYSRCYVKDSILSEVVYTILILIPSCYIDGNISPWSDILRSYLHESEVCFKKQIYGE